MSIYTEHGYRDRNDYLRQLALEHEVPVRIVLVTADLFGPNEDFDGLVTAMQDYAELSQ